MRKAIKSHITQDKKSHKHYYPSIFSANIFFFIFKVNFNDDDDNARKKVEIIDVINSIL